MTTMRYKLYVSEDFTEWFIRMWDADYPTAIRFHNTGPDRDQLVLDAEAFWAEHIEPHRAERERKAADRKARRDTLAP